MQNIFFLEMVIKIRNEKKTTKQFLMLLVIAFTIINN